MDANNAHSRTLKAAVVSSGAAVDEVLPRYDFRERHSRVIAAPRQAVWEAIETVTLAEMPVVGALFALRSLPARLSARPGLPHVRDEPVLAQFLETGFARLAEEPGRELVFGLIDQMWKRRGETAKIGDGAEFLAFDRAGFVKAAMNFRLAGVAAGTLLETETRVLATDAAARKGFGRYWLLIRPASGLIRRIWLRAIARRATRAEQMSA